MKRPNLMKERKNERNRTEKFSSGVSLQLLLGG